jgi:gamma-glutamyltranspeptidase/glutathione hydrolase
MNFNFSNPYLSTRLPVFARNVVVHLAPPGLAGRPAHAASNGGNAIDAAIAAAAAHHHLSSPSPTAWAATASAILWDGKEPCMA